MPRSIALVVCIGIANIIIALPLAWLFLRNDPAEMDLWPDGDQPTAAASQASAAPVPPETVS